MTKIKKARLSDVEQAERAARLANARLTAIRDAERYAENKGLLGKTFKLRNCYSCPEKPSDYWPLYIKVQEIDKAGMLTMFQFEADKFGRISIRLDRYRYDVMGATEISAPEFNKAWRALQSKIAKTTP